MKKQMKVILLAGVIVFESVFASVGSVNAQTVSENEIGTVEESVSKNSAVEEETPEVATEEVQAEGDPAEEPKIPDNGIDGGVIWSIDENGQLILTGDGDYEGEPDWLKYNSEIISAVVTVTNMTSTNKMFYDCNKLTSIDVSRFDTSKVTDMYFMFGSCTSLKSLDLSGFNTSNVTDMKFMFAVCSGLTSLDLSSFDTSNVTDMDGMFAVCLNLTNLDLTNFNTSHVTSMICMFQGCESLTSLDVSNFDTSNVRDMGYMFHGCSSLTELDVSKFVTNKVTNMPFMFSHCERLRSLDLSSWNLSLLQNSDAMLDKMDALIRISLPQSPVEIKLPGTFCAGENGTYTLQEYAESYCGMNGHTYSSPIFTWAEDYSSAQVYMECTREDCAYDIDDKHVQMDAIITKETVQPTMEKEGATVYTATVVHKGKTYTDVKSVTIPKLPQEPTQPQEPASPQNPASPQDPTNPQDPTSPQKPAAKPVGTILKTSKASYRVTKAGKTPEVAYVKPKSKKVKTVTIPATVKKGGVTYKVTSVADNALKNCKKMTKVTVGKNVTKIGKNAFYGCKKLKKIIIKSKKLKSVGKNAFKGIKKNATIDVPNSKKSKYKKFMKKKKTGYKKTMKIK